MVGESVSPASQIPCFGQKQPSIINACVATGFSQALHSSLQESHLGMKVHFHLRKAKGSSSRVRHNKQPSEPSPETSFQTCPTKRTLSNLKMILNRAGHPHPTSPAFSTITSSFLLLKLLLCQLKRYVSLLSHLCSCRSPPGPQPSPNSLLSTCLSPTHSKNLFPMYSPQ